jgi:hypothetical protein
VPGDARNIAAHRGTDDQPDRQASGTAPGDLATASGVSEATVARLESEDGPIGGHAETGEKLVAAFEGAGIEFIAENGGGAGVRLKRRQSKR